MNPDGALEIAFDVPGWPPLKNEAKSMLAASHKHHGSVEGRQDDPAHLRQTLGEYAPPNYNGRRPHRALALQPRRADRPVVDLTHERISRRPVLAGLINEYERAA